MILAMAGLPGTGKTVLARLLADALSAHLLSKDALRHLLFGPHTAYDRDQDDWTFSVIAQTTRRILAIDSTHVVILDGRTFLHVYQQRELAALAAETNQTVHILECRCQPGLARHRINADLTAGTHPAVNRTVELYDQIAATADPIPDPKLLITTDRPPAAVLHEALTRLSLLPNPSDPFAERSL